ncbi:heme-binding protein soul3 isoform X2 [Labrus mixtus]|uniref:heme-binding protein soul3 isoform X2 n=1 Tax=Labrus mixtus TaxID=508554 RepID=UPI0029C0FA62|nr:heme-binding protein soul3 isoform X2 [Labrus mixtus]
MVASKKGEKPWRTAKIKTDCCITGRTWRGDTKWKLLKNPISTIFDFHEVRGAETVNSMKTREDCLDMAEPIQQLTSNNQGRSQRQLIPFTLLGRKEKCGELLYEKRQYEKGRWACITMREDTYEQSICYGFMRIMRYICQQNSLGDYLGMTLPIITVVRTNETHSAMSNDVTVAYFLPDYHQAQPPQPTDNEIVIEIWPATTVYTRPFTGPTNEVTIIDQISAMAELLDSPGVCVNDSFIVAGYTNPAHSNRQNEIWFLERP